MTEIIKKLGPGFLFAGAAIGVSHLVQSTRAGADYGMGLIWALILINLIKYPFFLLAPRYAASTGEDLLDGFSKLGRRTLILYFVITFATMFTIQTSVTIVTAGIAASLFQDGTTIFWTTLITSLCFLIILVGRYKLLDSMMKYIVIILTISTLLAVFLAFQNHTESISWKQTFPTDTVGIAFLIAFMGWMPAPLDVTVWQSIWTIEKKKMNPSLTLKDVNKDFNIGFVVTVILGIGFIALGALVMFGMDEGFSNNGTQFANQLINMYTVSLGSWARILIGIAALTAMFSTTLTTLDASPRVMHKSSQLILKRTFSKGPLFWLVLLVIGTLSTFLFFVSSMLFLIQVATVISFLTAPIYALLIYKLLNSKHTPKEVKPTFIFNLYCIASILFLIGFGIWYLITAF